jgi:hypothetical protein
VRDAPVDGRQGAAPLQFSSRPEVEPIWQDVLAGILRHVSVGYTVERWRDDIDPATGERTRTAIAWTPIEISLVPTPADPGSTVRTGGNMPEAETHTDHAARTPPAENADAVQTRAQTTLRFARSLVLLGSGRSSSMG